MRGRPLVEMALFALAWCVLVWPLSRLTRGGAPLSAAPAAAPAAAATEPAPAAAATPTWLTVRVAPAAERVLLTQAGATVAALASGQGEAEAQVRLQLADGKAALDADFAWPAGVSQGVVEVTLEPDGLPGQAQRLWGRGAGHGRLEYRWTP